jgi:hypothetical protein
MNNRRRNAPLERPTRTFRPGATRAIRSAGAAGAPLVRATRVKPVTAGAAVQRRSGWCPGRQPVSFRAPLGRRFISE